MVWGPLLALLGAVSGFLAGLLGIGGGIVLVPGLYFAGEILDVDGVTGGFNLQFAFSSGFAAAQAVIGAGKE